MIEYKNHYWTLTCNEHVTCTVHAHAVRHAFTACCGRHIAVASQQAARELQDALDLYNKDSRPFAGLRGEEFLVKMGFGVIV